jgi:serine/threonine protein kinase
MTAENTDLDKGGFLRRMATALGRQALEAPEAPPIPELIGSYRVEKLLAKGGMGEVYLAHDDRLGRPVAIKQIRSDKPVSAEDRVRLRREAQSVARMSHPAIAQVHDVVYSDDGDSIVMQYVEGRTLAEIMSLGGIEPTMAMSVAREVAEGLAAAHAKHLVHRDLKAENIMVTPWGQAKILDFGLAKQMPQGDTAESLTAQGMLIGTISIMSPEQASGGQIDFRSDLFSFGILVYELFTGKSPFWRDRWIETLHAIRKTDPPSMCALRPDLPSELSDLVDQLLQKDPDKRPQDSQEVANVLTRIAGTEKLAKLPKPNIRLNRSSSRAWSSIHRLLRVSDWRPLRATDVVARAAPFYPAALLRRISPWWAAVFLLLGLAVIALVGRKPPTPRAHNILVLEPKLQSTEPDGTPDGAGAYDETTFGVLATALDTLGRWQGVVVLSPVEAAGIAGSVVERANAAGADEALQTAISCAQSCRVSFQRIRVTDVFEMPTITKITFPVDTTQPLQVAELLNKELRQLYLDKRPRPRPSHVVDAVDYVEYTRLRSKLAKGETFSDNDRAALSSILQRAPGFIEGHLLEVMLAQSLDEVDRAWDLAEAAGALDREDPDPRYLAIRLEMELTTGNSERAAFTLKELEKVWGNVASVERARSRLLAQRGDIEEALRITRRLVDEQVSWRNLWLLACHEAQAGDIEKERLHLRDLVHLLPTHHQALERLTELSTHND